MQIREKLGTTSDRPFSLGFSGWTPSLGREQKWVKKRGGRKKDGRGRKFLLGTHVASGDSGVIKARAEARGLAIHSHGRAY